MYPFMFQQQTSPIDEIEKTLKFAEAFKKALKDEEAKKKEPKPKKPADIFTTLMFFTVLTPFVMLTYGYFMMNMFLSVLEGIAKLKGLH